MRPRLLLLLLVLAAAGCGDSPTGTDVPVADAFEAPVDGAPRTSNVFDHEYPFAFQDANGYLLAWWGERVSGIDGHNGYDFVVGEGTPIRAVADGVVTFAGTESPFQCPLLGGATVAGRLVRVQHRLASGYYESMSLHLGRLDVQAGQPVVRGEQLGLSGNTGCSTGPHLHFTVRRTAADGTRGPAVDPYGWEAPSADPWGLHPSGATSAALWRPGAAPPLYSESVAPLLPGVGVGIVRARWMGVRDAITPSNEFVDVEKAPGIPVVALDGWTLRTIGAAPWTFPDGTTLDAARPRIRVYVGQPLAAGALGMGRTVGIIDNRGDCVVLQSPGTARYVLLIRTTSCPVPTTGALRRAIVDDGDATRAHAPSAVVAIP
jgi:hypothetical protein